MPNACLLIRRLPHYRHDSFAAGLRRAGWQVGDRAAPAPGNLLVIWNRTGYADSLARQYEAAGGMVLVAENGYFANPGAPPESYAISRGQHHHGLVEAAADPARKIHLDPWRTGGEHILVLEQRGIGSPLMASPRDWGRETAAALRQRSPRPIRLRRHPGNQAPEKPLEDDLRGAHAVAIWSSCGGIAALLAGIPVFYAAPRWIAESAALPLYSADLERPFLGDRLTGLRRAAANQWTVAEIESGAPFMGLA